jgi:hypothetical protein
MICAKYNYNYDIKEDYIGGVCKTNENGKECVEEIYGRPEGKWLEKDLEVDGWKICM